jgi:uncharacterized protein
VWERLYAATFDCLRFSLSAFQIFSVSSLMPTRAFIIHGYLSYPEEAWLPWMKRALEEKGCVVALPAMPRPDHPVIQEWLEFITQLIGEPNPDTILVGHSMGVQAVLRYLETLGAAGKAVGKTLLVAGSFPLARSAAVAADIPPVLVPWFTTGIDAAKVKQAAGRCSVILSNNDPYLDSAQAAATFREKLGANVVIVPGGGHFNEDDKLTELPPALDALFPPGHRA